MVLWYEGVHGSHGEGGLTACAAWLLVAMSYSLMTGVWGPSSAAGLRSPSCGESRSHRISHTEPVVISI